MDSPIIRMMHNCKSLRLMFFKMKDYRLEKNKNKSEWNRIVIPETWRLEKDNIFWEFWFIYSWHFVCLHYLLKWNQRKKTKRIIDKLWGYKWIRLDSLPIMFIIITLNSSFTFLLVKIFKNWKMTPNCVFKLRHFNELSGSSPEVA